jgi:hypothetical protein
MEFLADEEVARSGAQARNLVVGERPSADQEREQTGEEPVQHGHEHLAKSEPQVDLSANGEVRVPFEFLYPTGFSPGTKSGRQPRTRSAPARGGTWISL